MVLLLTACSSIDVEVHPAQSFTPTNYRSLAWATAPLDTRTAAELRALERDVRRAVEQGLVARGYPLQTSATATPDLLIDYRWSRRVEPRGAGSVSPRDEMARMIDLDPTPAGDSALYRHPIADVAEQVSLRVSLRDAVSRKLVWWGSATTVAARDDQHAAQKLVDRLAGRLLRELPEYAP